MSFPASVAWCFGWSSSLCFCGFAFFQGCFKFVLRVWGYVSVSVCGELVCFFDVFFFVVVFFGLGCWWLFWLRLGLAFCASGVLLFFFFFLLFVWGVGTGFSYLWVGLWVVFLCWFCIFFFCLFFLSLFLGCVERLCFVGCFRCFVFLCLGVCLPCFSCRLRNPSLNPYMSKYLSLRPPHTRR